MAAVSVGVRENKFVFRFFPSAGITGTPAQRVSLVILNDSTTLRAVENSVDVCVGLHGLGNGLLGFGILALLG